MSAKYLHIISFNIPHPADYGGVIDIFYKIKALRAVGVQVILHCFEYGRQPSKELEDLCFKVYYYHRKSGLKYFLSSDPYIVATRSANTMPKNLLRDSFPVLFEGLHTTGLLEQSRAAHKLILVRAHNIEHNYYQALSKSENQIYRKLFLRTESRKLRSYEAKLRFADYILGIAKHETSYFEKKFGNALFIPAFHRFEEVSSLEGSGDYILFHGNLGVAENSEMFLKLTGDVLAHIGIPVIVAGKNPSKRFLKKLAVYPQIRIYTNPSDEELDELIQNAHVNLLHTEQATGIKLKLLHALFAGRHCMVNPQMVEGTGLSHLCIIERKGEDLGEMLEKTMAKPITRTQLLERKKALKEFSNRAGAEKILRLIS